MTVVFYGCRGYLRMSGILNSKEQYLNGFTAKPSRATHPRIAAKIQKTYHIWHASRALREKKADNAKLAAKTSIQAGLVKTPELMQNDSPMGSIAKKVRVVYWFTNRDFKTDISNPYHLPITARAIWLQVVLVQHHRWLFWHLYQNLEPLFVLQSHHGSDQPR